VNSRAVLEIENVSYSYDTLPVLDSISMSVFQNEFIGIIGPNGGGKTTLLRIILGQLAPKSGSVKLFGKKPREVLQRIGYMPQYSSINKRLLLSVEEIVAMGLFKESHLFPFISKAKHKKIESVLAMLGLEKLKKKFYSELSGGQKQRTLLARAIISEPDLLLLDEPTSSIDYHTEIDIYDYLRELNKEMTVLLVSHDISVISTLVDIVVCLNRNVAIHKKEDITTELITRELYNSDVGVVHHKCEL
jgi:zinc transport system ATP-binding protein